MLFGRAFPIGPEAKRHWMKLVHNLTACQSTTSFMSNDMSCKVLNYSRSRVNNT